MKKPHVNASLDELIEFVHAWVKLCAQGRINEAFLMLDPPIDPKRYHWQAGDLAKVTFDHFDDNQQPVITDPDSVSGNIRKDVYEYNDGSGWGVEYNLPLNNVVSDFTLMFDFKKVGNELKVILDDCHVM